MSNSKFKIEFTLKQHTPMIHFQSEQKGATLRATELKPKLDRFLIEKLNMLENKKPKDEYKPWFIGGGKLHLALDYKVRIEEKNEIKPLIYESDFIGNMDNNAAKISEKFSKGIIYISFQSFVMPLLEEIENFFPDFLLENNFGARTSKGYGSFYLYDKKETKFIEPDFSKIPNNVYSFQTIREDCIKDINLFSAFLRSGLNYPDKEDNQKTRIYIKSALYSYLNEETEITWDKKAIKQAYSNGNDTILEENATLARDLFGLSVRQEWGRAHNGMVITKTNNEITRFKSPVRFKPLIDSDIEAKSTADVTVYFWADDSYKSMLDKEFSVLSNGRGGLRLKIPESFNFNDFFEYLVKKYSLSIDSVYKSQPEENKLQKILKDMKESVDG